MRRPQPRGKGELWAERASRQRTPGGTTKIRNADRIATTGEISGLGGFTGRFMAGPESSACQSIAFNSSGGLPVASNSDECQVWQTTTDKSSRTSRRNDRPMNQAGPRSSAQRTLSSPTGVSAKPPRSGRESLEPGVSVRFGGALIVTVRVESPLPILGSPLPRSS